MSIDHGRSPSEPGCQPSASAAEEASSLSGIPNAEDHDNPERHLPLSGEEKFAAFIIYIRALEAAGLSPGFGRIRQDDAKGVDFAFGLPNFMLRNAILTAPETVAEAADILAQNAASAIEAATAGETTEIGSTEGESAVGNAETPEPLGSTNPNTERQSL